MSGDKKNTRISDLIGLMDSWAPTWYAEPWDKVGLLVGDPGAKVRKAWVALELKPGLVAEAKAAGVSLLFLHHPPIFSPLDNLRMDNPATAELVEAAASGIGLFAAHTNLDSASGGVNDALAKELGLTNTRPIQPLNRGLAKLVFFVPAEEAEKVLEAVFAAGAGRIGDYADCSFCQPGVGSFSAPIDGNPYIGDPGSSEKVQEQRVETVLPLTASGKAIKALYKAHPYEEPAFDLYPLKQGPVGVGLGRVGDLEKSMPGKEFAAFAARRLGAVAPHLAGPLPDKVERVAVLGGSGGDLVDRAAATGAEVYVTGEAKHNHAYDAMNRGICLLCLGHYETEEIVVKPWTRRLAQMAAKAGCQCDISPYPGGANPWDAPPI
jgi:dinuclear metal center YbgI/SA1388 family protein